MNTNKRLMNLLNKKIMLFTEGISIMAKMNIFKKN